MGKGLAQALLKSSIEVFKGATPISKLTTPGFLQYVLENNKPNILSIAKDDGSGYMRDVKIRYRTRGTTGRSVTVDDCSIQAKPAYQEITVPATQFRSFGLLFSDDEIAAFEKDALAPVTMGTPAMSGIMIDIMEAIIEQTNGFFGDINNDLLSMQAANFGLNVKTASNAAKTINFPLSNASNNLQSGMIDVMADAMENEMRLAGACIVGSGLVNNYYLQQPAKSADQSGVNTQLLALPKFYYDAYAQAGWGANQFGLFERDAVQFVNTCRFRGIKAGQRGNSFFTTLKLPLTDSLGQGNLGAFEFDVQLTYRDCPGEVQIGAPGDGNPPVLVGRGMNVIISCAYQTVNIPSDSYAVGDRLRNVNGTYRYTATNA